jgi:SAM-dependent methyltransferase
MNCRFCQTTLEEEFLDLINSPASNSFLTEIQLNEPETFFPLRVFVCHKCFLVQIDEYKKSDSIFDSEYVYFSSYSSSWLAHAKEYVEMVIKRFSLSENSTVIEIASNDGYLLQNFLSRKIPVLGIEPTKNTAAVAVAKGIETITEFFGSALAKTLIEKKIGADLFLGNNVLAHVPDIVDLVKGMKIILRPGGVVTMEFPHLMQLIRNTQFDTIYHEHFSYLSFYSVKKIFESQGLQLFDVEEIATHGGSLRIYAKHAGNESIAISASVGELLKKEVAEGITDIGYYKHFRERVLKAKLNFIHFLVERKKQGRSVAGYGAAAKGNTLLNYCGIKNDLISFVVDANPAKQNKYLPGSHIPVVNEDRLKLEKPDFVVIFPWNIREEIINQLGYIREWNGKFVVPIPELEII